MTFKVVKSEHGGVVVFHLSGRLDAEHVTELEHLIEAEVRYHSIVLDMKDVRLVDRDAVRFLAHCQTEGARLDNCPAYIQEWMRREWIGMYPR